MGVTHDVGGWWCGGGRVCGCFKRRALSRNGPNSTVKFVLGSAVVVPSIALCIDHGRGKSVKIAVEKW